MLHDVRLSRVGDMTYGAGQTPIPVGPDGVAIITRDDATVFAADALASFVGKPVTIGHPAVPVTPENWGEVAGGHIMNARRGSAPYESFMVGDVMVTKPEAIQLAEDGCEISCGYDAAYEQTGPGRGRQTTVIGNHLAFLPDGKKGRCGPLCYIGDQSMDVEEPKIMTVKTTAGAALLRKLFGAKDDAEVQTVLDQATADEAASLLATKDAQIADLQAKLAAATKDGEEETAEEKAARLKKEKEDGKTADAAAITDLRARVSTAAEILSPGFTVPTVDSADLTATFDALCGCQRQALDKAMATADTKAKIEGVVGKGDLSKLTADQIDAKFFAAADLMGALNNKSLMALVSASGVPNPVQDQYTAIAEADERSKKRWARPSANVAA